MKDKEYRDIQLEQRYAPWHSDRDFKSCYEKVMNNSLVDVQRLYELWTLVETSLLSKGDVLEVGSWRGGSAALIATRLCARRKLFICDTFTGVVKAGERDNRYQGGEHADSSENYVSTFLSNMELSRWQILKGIFPEDSGALIEDHSFCFCHIDVDTYQSAKDITKWIWPRLSVGGIVVYDDYGFWSCQGVRACVDEFFATSRNDSLFFYNLNGHAVVLKKEEK